MQLDNTKIKRKNPINRNNFFFSENQFNVQMDFGMEYVNKVVNQTVILYEVDLNNTNINDIYNESKSDDISFKTPIELNVLYKIDAAELKTYDTKIMKGYYVNTGKLEFCIYEKELEENECDIKRGDYIGIQITPEHMEYFIVTDDGRVNYDNKHTLYGTKPYYRSVKCSVVNDNSDAINLDSK